MQNLAINCLEYAARLEMDMESVLLPFPGGVYVGSESRPRILIGHPYIVISNGVERHVVIRSIDDITGPVFSIGGELLISDRIVKYKNRTLHANVKDRFYIRGMQVCAAYVMDIVNQRCIYITDDNIRKLVKYPASMRSPTYHLEKLSRLGYIPENIDYNKLREFLDDKLFDIKQTLNESFRSDIRLWDVFSINVVAGSLFLENLGDIRIIHWMEYFEDVIKGKTEEEAEDPDSMDFIPPRLR